MSTIDEIMNAVICPETTEDDVRQMITAALADARRDGAEQMREAAADRIEGCDQETERWEYAEYVRALPLPTGSQS